MRLKKAGRRKESLEGFEELKHVAGKVRARKDVVIIMKDVLWERRVRKVKEDKNKTT